MDEKRRYRRLRLLVKKLDQERKKQAKKIDILCNDLIGAHREFIQRLDTISFAAGFYEMLIGTTDLSSVLHLAGSVIKQKIPGANVAFFLRRPNSFELHMHESDRPISLESQTMERCFTPELVGNICKANKICTIEDMFAMGLEGNLARLNDISAATIPLGRLSSSLGFILVYCSLENKLTCHQLRDMAAIVPGLSRAIQSCQTLLHSMD
ncbi:MAG: hypothetical protein ACYTEL_16245 [Planctomycetota bacterium]